MRQHRRSGPLDVRKAHLCICCANTSVRRALRPFLNLPSPPILQPVGPAICAGAAPLAIAVLADGQNPTLPCLVAGDVGRGFDAQRSWKIPMSETTGIERLGAFPAGCRVRRGGGMSVKNYTSISCHSFLPPAFPFASPANGGSNRSKVSA
jgi:hypothetical protein